MKRRHGKMRKREALKIETYNQALSAAVRHGRKYGVDADRARDIASDAYLAKARGALRRITAGDPKALAAHIAFGGVANELKRLTTADGAFGAGVHFDSLDDPAAPFDIGDGGRSAARCRLMCDNGPDPAPPTPLWQRMVLDVMADADPEMRRVAKAFTQCWGSEEARRKVKMTPSKFYRLRKKLKFLLAPCFTAYREWLRRRSRVR